MIDWRLIGARRFSGLVVVSAGRRIVSVKLLFNSMLFRKWWNYRGVLLQAILCYRTMMTLLRI